MTDNFARNPRRGRYDTRGMSKPALGACLSFLFMGAGCGTRPNPEFCNSSTDCADPAKPFCDVNGDFGDLRNDCIAQPPVDAAVALDAPPGGCTAGAALACTGDTLTTCNVDGHTTTASTCPLGCGADHPGCLTFVPSHGLAGALLSAGGKLDVTIPRGSTLNTDNGIVLDSSSNPIAVDSIVVAQTGGPSIRTLLGRSFTIDDVAVTGAAALAIVAPGEIHLIGRVTAHGQSDLSAPVRGPGAAATGACAGASAENQNNSPNFPTPGSGGGGHATPGGHGGPTTSLPGGAGGSTSSDSGPLVGGCGGGFVTFHTSDQTVTLPPGPGGGAIQLVSTTNVQFDTAGGVDVGGGGGTTNTGGGAGGTVWIEAPVLTISGPQSGVAANGGAGASNCEIGANALFATTAAPGSVCFAINGGYASGSGGTVTTAPQDGQNCRQLAGGCGPDARAGGGGGSVGTLVIRTRNGGYQLVANPVVSAVIAATSLATTP